MRFSFLFALNPYSDKYLKSIVNGYEAWVSGWLLFNAKWALFQIYHCENKLHQWDENDVRFVLDPHA